MKQKFILFLFVAMFIGTIVSTNASDVREFDPTKVLVDVETGTVIFMPRTEDYNYDLMKRQMEAQERIIIEDGKPKSVKEKVFGKCNKRG
jgi:hypothetical protein